MAAALPTEINKGVAWSPTNPHTWLRLLGDPPNETGPCGIRVMYGVLRPDCQGHAVSAAAFARAKLVVAIAVEPEDWGPTAYRHEVLLPAHADDRLRDPRTLFTEVDETLPPGGRMLATYITLSWMPMRLHAAFELGRRLARDLVEAHSSAVLLVQHVPAFGGSTNPPHLHLLVTRPLLPFGQFSPTTGELGRDRGRQQIVDRVAALVAGGRA